MSLRPVLFRSRDLLLKCESCVCCQLHQILRPVRRNALWHTTSFANWDNTWSKRRQWIRNYATIDRMTPAQVRVEVDNRSRFNYFTAVLKEGVLCTDALTAEAIFSDVRARGNSVDVVSLAKKYKLEVEDIATYAMVIARIPDVQDEVRRSRLPPSIHKPIAKLLLLGCVTAKDPLAILIVLNAVLQSITNPSPKAREKNKQIASLLNTAEIAYCREELEAFAARKDPDAMNLLGQLLEREGQKSRARTLYEAAFETAAVKPNPESARTLFLPLVPAWNALGNLLLADKDPKAQELAKAAFEKGALKADDPVSYYHLASFEDKGGVNWLKYMNKAAATGHVEAMYKLGKRYENINSHSGAIVPDASTDEGQLKKALSWLRVKRGATQDLAEEWYGVAAGCGYKPAMHELVKLAEIKGDEEKVKTYLQKMTEPPPTGETEKWPRLVEEAKTRLRG